MRKHLLLGCSIIAITLMAACGSEKQTLVAEKKKETQAAATTVAAQPPAPASADVYASPQVDSAAPLEPSKGIVPFQGQSTLLGQAAGAYPADGLYLSPSAANENYAAFDDSAVKRVADAPVSTFSIDVDSGSYANIRRFLMNGQKPPQDSVRVEEMLNYFTYDYPAPKQSGQPFQATTDLMTTPWNADTKLLRIGIKGYAPDLDERPAANLVFLVDVSGSMQDADKLLLLKSSLRMLVNNLGPKDKITLFCHKRKLCNGFPHRL